MNKIIVVGDDHYARAIFDFIDQSVPNSCFLVDANLPGFQDHLTDADWIIEATGQILDVKRMALARIADAAGNAVITSDSSIFMRSSLMGGFTAEFQKRYAVSHFFFPLQHCRLVELVTASSEAETASPEAVELLEKFLSDELQRFVVQLPDCAGFCANRLGLYMIAAALSRTRDAGANCAEMDRLAIPALKLARSGLFGTADMIGLNTLTALFAALAQYLPADDIFHEHANGALAALEHVRTSSDGRLIDRDRQSGRGFSFASGKMLSEDSGFAEAIVEALAHDKDRYTAQVAAQNNLDHETFGQIMRHSYGWGS